MNYASKLEEKFRLSSLNNNGGTAITNVLINGKHIELLLLKPHKWSQLLGLFPAQKLEKLEQINPLASRVK